MNLSALYCMLFLTSCASCDWIDSAKQACQAKERTFNDKDLLIKSQCIVKCVKEGEKVIYEKLADGTECESKANLMN
ncbi:hypothetical protein N7530_004313 [Penicillium desertorum]|uniref:Lipoprotein n=1 Tax=Penicillium desertorum TaxID=1303715 RepID=A0A9X0BQ92_9EURO|nr:hypothetical protein N7530_004313 [Penicillium desertorum]